MRLALAAGVRTCLAYDLGKAKGVHVRAERPHSIIRGDLPLKLVAIDVVVAHSTGLVDR